MRSLYTLVLRALLPLILLRLWWRGRREPRYREGLAERFGHYGEAELEFEEIEESPAAEEHSIWIHAVSVGEARAAAPLVQALQQALPGHSVVMSCMTAAGRETLKQVYGESVYAVYLPYDYPEAVQRFLEHFRPRLGVVMETEMWPNLLAACEANGLPVLLANARMSEKSARGYARFAWLTGPAIRSFAAVCAQSEDDAERLRTLGARAVEVAGNLKFDVRPAPEQITAGHAWRERLGRPVLLLASTREGEEEMLLNEIRNAGLAADLLILLVPRHPKRFDDVARFAQARRTQDEFPSIGQTVFLGDTMGEMPFYFAACDVALMGGSFLPLGGQNLIEGLAAGAPVIAGPSMFNFAEATRLAVKAGAALQARDAAAAVRLAGELLRDAARRERMSRAGRKLCDANRGATERHLRVCLRLMERSSP
jgi:3-deoxy-D-manno-octulosonic-acid transferase